MTQPAANDSQTNSAHPDRELYYPLTRSELAKLCKLKPVEIKVFLYLKTLDPFGNTFQELDMEDLKATTGIRSLGSIYPALAHLHELGLIRWFVSKSYVHVMDQCTDPRITRLIHRSAERSADQQSDPRITALKNQELEPAQGESFKSPQTNKTNKTLKTNQKNKKTREGLEDDPEFQSWIDRGLDSLPKPPQGNYRAKLRKKELQDETNQREFLEWKQKQSRGSVIPPRAEAIEKIPENEPASFDDYWQRLQARMSGGEV